MITNEPDMSANYGLDGRLQLLSLVVHGEPKPQGSKRHVGHGVMVESSKGLKPWREQVARGVRALGIETILGPVHVELTFYLQRPKSHWGTGRNMRILKPNAPEYHAARPDADKLTRAVLDALTESALLRDDGQVAVLIASKRYAATPGVWIRVRPLS